MTEWEEKLVQNLEQNPRLQKPGAVVALFHPFGSEPNLSALTSRLPKAQWCYPKITSDADRSMHFVQLDERGWREGPLGTTEPIHEQPVEQLDAVLVPGLAFDLLGTRLGRGAGFYDTFLRDKPHIFKVGVCYSGQIVDGLPRERHDVRMDAICSEQGWIMCSSKGEKS
jgi:5-formyltetrahydrofolate cyclo-ligase